MSTAISGVAGKVLGGVMDYDVTGWTGDPEVDDFDTTTTADAGWEDCTPSTKKFSGSFDFFYNLAKKPTGAGANLSPGSTPVLHLQIQSGEEYTGTALIKKLSIKSKTKEGITITATFKSKGAWTYPS